ncbi:hypothetical protein JW756_05525 [Candidatus Woesearchaeota archaeon]|nr:hypothetical protein [Candidatus Woesearchaeota archaeon]
MSPQPYEHSIDEIAKRDFDDYELSMQDKKSIQEIKKKIKKGYKNLEEVEQHQEFLEDLTNKLRGVLQNEKSIGMNNWELERQMGEIQSLYFELETIRKEKAKQEE